jgi:hypothetical protein
MRVDFDSQLSRLWQRLFLTSVSERTVVGAAATTIAVLGPMWRDERLKAC